MLDVEKFDFGAVFKECQQAVQEYCETEIKENSVEEFLFASEMYFCFLANILTHLVSFLQKPISTAQTLAVLRQGIKSMMDNMHKDIETTTSELEDVVAARVESYMKLFTFFSYGLTEKITSVQNFSTVIEMYKANDNVIKIYFSIAFS